MGVIHLTGVLRGTQAKEAWIDSCGRLTFTNPGGQCQEVTGWIYPGLVDAHAHPGTNYELTPVDDAEVYRRLEIMRSQGVTAAREMGAQRDIAPLLAKGLPKVLRAGQHIARFKRYIKNMPIDVEPADLASEVARQAQAGDGWVKIVGDWIDRSRGVESDLAPLWPRQALIEAVAAAHECGAKVAVHTFARETIEDLLLAGVDSIEHGTGMTREHIQEARRQGILVDPTVRQISTFPQIAAGADKYPVYRARMLAMDAERREHLALFLEEGVELLMGSDSGEFVARDGIPSELVACVENGFPPSLVMASASYRGRELLGLPSWEEGAPGDFVVYSADPEEDISVCREPSAVFIDGIRF